MEAQKIVQKGKKKVLLERLRGQKTALTKAVTQSARSIALAISNGTLPIPKSNAEVIPFAQGITAVQTTKIPLVEMLEALRTSRSLAEKADDESALGAVFKASCRVDEIFFGKDE